MGTLDKLACPQRFRPARSLKKSANLGPAANPHASSPGSNSSTSVAKFHDFQASIVDHFKKGADGEDLSKSFSQNLKALMPENVFSSHAANLQMIVSQHHSSAAVNFLNLTLFMMSNKFFEPDSDIYTQVYNWIKRRSDAGFLEYLLSISGPTAEALVEQLLPLAIEAGDARTVKKMLNSGLDPNELRCSRACRPQITPLQRACELRSLELVRVLLDAGADVNSSPSGTCSPLTCAVDHMDEDGKILDHVDIELVQVLLRAGANVNPAPNESPLINAAANCHVELVTVLLSAGADPNFFNEDHPATPLTEAVQSEGSISDIISIVRHLLQAGANAHATIYDDDEALTVLDYALCQSRVDLIQVLLEAGAHTTESTLISAVCSNLDIVKLFLSSGARVTQKVIEHAASNGESEIFWLLLDSADDGTKERSLSGALTAAIHHGKKDLIDMLCASGVELRSTPELTAAIEAAADRGDISVLRLLLNDDSTYRPSAVKSLGCSLCSSIAKGRSDITKMLLAAGADVNSQNSETKRTPLLEAILQRDADLSQRLLAAGAAVNTTNSDFLSLYNRCTVSVLPAAVAWGYYPLIRDIIGAGAEINTPESEKGKTALTVAVERGDRVTIQLLIDAGADVNASAASYFGHTALAAAVGNNDINMVRYLLALGADPNEQSLIAAVPKSPELMQIILTARLTRYQRYSRGFGSRALQYAITSSNAAMIEVLLSNGVDPNTIVRFQYGENQGWASVSFSHRRDSAFGTAIRLDRSNDLWMIQMLLRGGANPNKIVCETPNQTALLAAINKKSLRLVKTLIAAGANVNPKLVARISHTPLQLAAEQGSMDITDALLEQGADVNASPCDRYGATALQFAAIKGYLGIASVLLEKGADINASPAKVGGRTALEGASEHGRIDMLQFLLKAGAQVIGLGSEQYERARKFASKNGHIAARRLLETYHAQQLDGHAAWDLSATDVGNIEDVEFEDWTHMGQDRVDPIPGYS